MDRDRDRDRRPFPREDQYGDGRGQSYRPPRSPPPRSDTYRAPRSPPRGNAYVDSYRAPPRNRTRSPLPFRRRSRSPPPFRPRDGGDSYRGRPRSPPPRRGGFMRDETYRPPPASRFHRDTLPYNTRSPVRAPRDRSPLPLKRGRDVSPAGSRGRRSPPPPAKRERLDSPPRSRYNAYPPSRDVSPGPGRDRREMRLTPPRGVTRGYRLLSRSPMQHNENINPRKVDWRRRSPSPARPRPDLMSTENSGPGSVTSSRRSSPPIHPSRLATIDTLPKEDLFHNRGPRAISPAPAPPRSPVASKPRSPIPPRPRLPIAPPADVRSPIRKREPTPPREREIPTGPANRAPPTGPARHDEVPQVRAPPTGPGASRSYAQAAGDVPIPTGPRMRVNSPPTHPRGGMPSRGGYQRDYPPRDFGSRGDYHGPRGRGGPYGGPSYRGGRGGGYVTQHNRDPDFVSAPPSGPRGSMGPHGPAASFRGGAHSSGTYPRTTRFAPNGAPLPSGPKADIVMGGMGEDDRGVKPVNVYLADLPRIVDGGIRAPELYDRGRLNKLEDEAEKLRQVIEDKQARKRKGLREWAKLSRESETASYRAQLADENVRALAGENDGGAAY
ncbi:hypothetical protein AUEXF2481DRAFT_1936 [Aureobasidium subglaciale EXF-2481]|uniref:Serine/arginine repetitive matrix protein 1 n=1 Tax=Aureobasidium subglaciale (strain EXF-2481) TaxID=1043005 RepID=A0A074YSL6_AURSE|nr:uncharacterized protein AUEXF2481DRAFT_1936 [Aureobasidium subglaciale EXF-2481]KAI5207639.1 hypothetical protein E4T38_03186 [Aureobasidium subglaciale]KAI5226529.1 hypothetical protein E4T40_02960 [Aureobasidium subglaciale]KAI5229986.1 hypothetical protein E4T41_03183 [Aureobasidium subglaciale]KAI5264447.1 hypothetical protein E4T46_02961 [Aureobasidium subglaciale]KEQ99119.1 hypothetical protein AUEXF2481DRAFT_1936 [Aureobasidium subglaciale EXF-2481]